MSTYENTCINFLLMTERWIKPAPHASQPATRPPHQQGRRVLYIIIRKDKHDTEVGIAMETLFLKFVALVG